MVSIYDPLTCHLKTFSGKPFVVMTFNQIEAVLGQPLPPSAYKWDRWWDNTHTQARGWQEAGFAKADPDLRAKRVIFRR